jgi:Zn-dependent peptidase ImmA (M78 family)/DNA-binding XRE family transcriptional regulator
MTGLGDVIITARLARGLTQAELAAMIDVTQPALHRYEHGLREPEPEILERLAGVLGVTEDFLLHAGKIRGAMAVDAHMRRHATEKATTWRRLEAQLNEYRMHASKLFEQVSLRADQLIPTFDPEGTAPTEAARLLRMQWRMPVGPVRDLTGWLEAAGCIVLAEPFGTPRIDGLSQWIDDHPVILLNDQAPTDRQRWTLAHEAGHLCMHASYIGDHPEADADGFAAEFLMPAEVIRPQLRNLTMGRLTDLKRQWGVSMQALVERAHQMGVVTAGQRMSMYKQFSRMGWRTREPYSEDLAVERPHLAEVITQALTDKGFSPHDIAVMAGFADAEHNSMFKPGGRALRAVLVGAVNRTDRARRLKEASLG